MEKQKMIVDAVAKAQRPWEHPTKVEPTVIQTMPDMELLIRKKLLQSFTKECRPDMHEPDEQGISATVVGRTLDNACGADVRSGELVVILTKEGDDGKTEILPINLATLIAMARV